MEGPCKKSAKCDRSTDHSRTQDLPGDIMPEILSRLPTKTLISCKSICKSWLNLISDPQFMKLHHQQRSPGSSELLLRSDNCDRNSIMLYSGKLQFRNNSMSNIKLSPLLDLAKLNVTSNNSITLGPRERRRHYFINSCNGLVCFSNSDDFCSTLTYAVICNPFTGEFVTVPRTEKEKKVAKIFHYGLGFSVKETRYKLLRVMGQHNSKQFAEICTFEKGSSWRSLEDCPYHISNMTPRSSDFIIFEQKLHFHCAFPSRIGCFDFDIEKFGEIPLPPRQCNEGDEYDDTYKRARIGVLQGCLSLTRYERSRCSHAESDKNPDWWQPAEEFMQQGPESKGNVTLALSWACRPELRRVNFFEK